jgi:hypothetical protein
MIIHDTITCHRTQMILALCDRAWLVPKSFQSSVYQPESLRGARHRGFGAPSIASRIHVGGEM